LKRSRVVAFKSSTAVIIAALFAAWVLALGVLLLVPGPSPLRQVYAWVAFAVAMLLVWAVLEWLGVFVFGARIFSRMSSVARIVLGVPLVVSMVALGYGLLWAVANAIAWLGSANAI
jgi:hypothetical protein